ncbi:sensor histidine kinase [Dictyobacter arantiisoli]|uniref:histidine kinase n=1 Tax=Dictyobacter arantiisoli TaxID=2014874 RepID=A0A5A5T7V0_9CHLR|nr:HAMP domain-containing sensor histidine kinase [Dictyobacter arantiisoli]GCF07468.1 hypothetical protein KDI_10320 [Dictyobacter arantiisoli]
MTPAAIEAEQGELERQMALVQDQFRQLQETQEQFVSNMNHELRTPLTAVYGYFGLLQYIFEKNGTLEYESHASYMRNAVQYCEDLCSIVNNILKNMDIDHQQQPIPGEECSLAQMIQELCSSGDLDTSEQQRLQIQLPAHDLMAYTDSSCLRHVLQQLISNAFKYTPEASPVMISATAYDDAMDYICISVTDRGPGIPPAEQDRIFEQFVRLKRDIAGTVQGAGLGLTTCKHLIESMQGKIWVESTGIMGEGSSFRFILPRTASVRKQPVPGIQDIQGIPEINRVPSQALR